MFRNLTIGELRESQRIDSYSYLQHVHFTENPCPDLTASNVYPPSSKETKEDRDNEERIRKAIQAFVEKSI
jgi:hypothetical protein